MWLGISVISVFLCAVLLLYIFFLKREMKSFRKELLLTREKTYNRQLRVSLFDRDLTELAAEMNRNLDYQKQLKLQAEQTEGRLKQSVSDIAHDLRTPLTVIKGNLQMMNRDGSMSETDKAYLSICQDKTETLKNMVDDFFELSVLESDNIPAALSDVDVTRLLVQFVVDHEAVIRAHRLVPDVKLPEKSVIVSLNEQMFSRMLSNLLNNVIKYAEDSFRLSMEVLEVDEKAVCRIAFSNGLQPGANPDVEHLFERTYRGNQVRQGSGAGLGLYIVKLLADRQGIEVFAEREADELTVGMRCQIKG
jgi:signal transduction histidine kinase